MRDRLRMSVRCRVVIERTYAPNEHRIGVPKIDSSPYRSSLGDVVRTTNDGVEWHLDDISNLASRGLAFGFYFFAPIDVQKPNVCIGSV